jgi:hypothetical protein
VEGGREGRGNGDIKECHLTVEEAGVEDIARAIVGARRTLLYNAVGIINLESGQQDEFQLGVPKSSKATTHAQRRVSEPIERPACACTHGMIREEGDSKTIEGDHSSRIWVQSKPQIVIGSSTHQMASVVMRDPVPVDFVTDGESRFQILTDSLVDDLLEKMLL